MRRALILVGGILCAGVSLWSEQAVTQETPPVFSARADTVIVHATVRAANGRLVTNLQRDAFRVTDNGRPADIVAFSNDPQPVTGLTFVQAGTGTLPRYRAVARAFAAALGPGDRLAIGSAGGYEVAISPHLTSDQQILQRVVSEEIWPTGPSPGLAALLFDRARARLEHEHGRKAIVFMTFRCLRETCAGMGSRVARLRDDGVIVYCIDVDSSTCSVGLRSFVDGTGGGYVRVNVTTNLAVVFAEVRNELRHQYILGIPAARGDVGTHRLEVSTTRRGLRVTATRQYRVAGVP
jgi:VWFA-related protein